MRRIAAGKGAALAAVYGKTGGGVIAGTGKKQTGRDAYKAAGVDIDAGNALVERIKPFAKATARAGLVGGLGGFGGLFDPKAAGFDDPILVAATDGVGTKLKLAVETGRHGTVGIDLVAMCVNDLVVQGAEPLFFLDYFATGGLDVEQAAAVIEGIAKGCGIAGCALLGGETAEMPGMYAPGEYDLAGFAVGAAERGTLLDGSAVAAGDTVLGIASSGVHSNGFSLVRRVAADAGLGWEDAAPFETGKALAEALLEPTRIYVRPCLEQLRAGRVKALAHITGGGLTENIPRVLPKGLGVRLDATAWDVPPVFGWLAEAGAVDAGGMLRTFNCGIGMAVITAEPDTVAAGLEAAGEIVYRIGAVERGAGVAYDNLTATWPN